MTEPTSTQPTSPQWFIARDGQQTGPFDDAAVRAMAASGALHPSQLVWQAGWPTWQPASSVPGLAFVVAPAPTSPIAPATGSGPPPLPFGVHYASPGAPRDIGESAGMRMLIPVGRSPWAIAAGYLGLFSLILLPAPIAVIISIIAIRDIKKHPNRHGMGRAIFGLVMGIICSVLFVMLILSSIR